MSQVATQPLVHRTSGGSGRGLGSEAMQHHDLLQRSCEVLPDRWAEVPVPA